MGRLEAEKQQQQIAQSQKLAERLRASEDEKSPPKTRKYEPSPFFDDQGQNIFSETLRKAAEKVEKLEKQKKIQEELEKQEREEAAKDAYIAEILERGWRRDEDVNICGNVQCNKPFSTTIRRHHCRSCGNIFCKECCKKASPRQCKKCIELGLLIYFDNKGNRMESHDHLSGAMYEALSKDEWR